MSGFFSPRWLVPAGLFLATFMTVVATANDYGVTWDEPPYFHASDLHLRWLDDLGENLIRGKLQMSFLDENIKAAWHWNPYHVPHPPFSRLVSGLAKEFSPPWIDKFSAYRLGPALFFSLLVTLMYVWMAELFDRATGLFASLCLIVTPNLFGFAHIAVTDLPLASMWFLAAYCFWRGLDNWRWSVVLGIVWGLALATKFPAVLVPAPLIFWAHIYHRRNYANNVCAFIFLSPIVMVLIQPYLWHQTGLRILEFLYEGLSRGYRPETSHAIFYFGQLYLTNQLPWHYPFFVVGITTPETILALALLATLCTPWLREQKTVVILFTLHAAFILGIGLLPGAVLHDGARQLLAVLPFIVALAGVGFFVLMRKIINLCIQLRSLEGIKRLHQKITAAVIVLILFVPALDVYLIHPFQLSYYNRFVGGIRGAYARGLEITYFMEAFTPELLQRLNAMLPTNATINAAVANFMFEYYQQEGRLRKDLKFTTKEPFDYYLLLNRQSVMKPAERLLLRNHRPVIFVEVAGVPLVALFRIEKPG